MTKISVYNIDEYVTADDKWIGTDVNTYNKTKNFTPRKLSHYFNNNQVINTGVDLLYKYFTITPPETRPTGTLSFETEIGPTVNFSTISTFLLSNTTLKGNYIVEFFDFLVGKDVLLYKAKNINLFGNYKILSVEEYLPEPNFFIVNVEFVEGNGFIEEDEDYMISLIGSPEEQSLQDVTDIGSTTTNSITANSFVKIGGTGSNVLLDNGNAIPITSIVGTTNLTTSQTASNFTINSDTGTDASVPLGNGTLAGATLNDYTTDEKNKLAAITGTNTGDQNLQSVTDKGNITNKTIIATVSGTNPAITGYSINGAGIYGQSEGKGVWGYSFLDAAVYGYAESVTGIAIKGYAEDGVAGEFRTDSITANIANFKNGGTVLASINNAGELTAQKLIKQGGTSSEILAADGSVITAGTNITITGGQISSVGGAGGGGSSVNYYLNGGTSQGTFGGTTYYEFSKTAVIGTGADFTISSNGYIASFITDVADPSLLLIPAGNWNLEFFFSSSSAGGSPSFYAELYKYDGTTFTLIASGSAVPEGITNGTAIDAYFTALAVPETVLTVNDRLAIRVYINASSKTITLHTQNGHLCEVITTFTAGLTALNGLQAQVQNFATGTSGTDFAINSSGSTHTFNLPDASATARGVVTTGVQTFAGEKTFSSNIRLPVSLANTSATVVYGLPSTGELFIGFDTIGPTALEMQYVKGVTSFIQTQFSGKQPLATNLTSLAGLTYSTPAFVKMTAAGTFTLDTSGGAITLSAIGAAPNANAATITGSVLNLQPANASFGGVVSTGVQTFAGEKTFSVSPKAPTPTIGTNDTTLATTEFVNASIPGNMAYNIIISSFPSNAITTETTGTSNGVSYPQDGRNVMISNGATAITITANTLLTKNDFIASYTKVGTAAITFLFTGTGRTEIIPNGAILSGTQGSTALLTKNGNIFYLLINNLQ